VITAGHVATALSLRSDPASSASDARALTA